MILTALIQKHVELNRTWLEFGVAYGHSLKELALHAPIIYGFDSFKGLPEDWRDAEGRIHQPAGAYACPFPTNLPDNAYIVQGLFQDTLPDWLQEHHNGEPFGFVHIDCDLYSSTKFVLEQLEPYLDKTVVAFDEIKGFPATDNHESAAWLEFMDRGKYSAQFIGEQHYMGAIFKLTEN